MGIIDQFEFNSNMLSSRLLLICFLSYTSYGGISIPKDNCRWLKATEYNTELKCDGNEVVVGACGSGAHKDCPGGTVHELKCSAIPGYYYSGCNIYGTSWGVNNDCRDHGETLVLEGSCASGAHFDCNGSATNVECCSGHLDSKEVGPTSECTWEYSGYGVPLECGRSDEVVIGRCGAGSHLDCPGSTAHGNLCCELDYLSNK